MNTKEEHQCPAINIFDQLITQSPDAEKMDFMKGVVHGINMILGPEFHRQEHDHTVRHLESLALDHFKYLYKRYELKKKRYKKNA